jgi:hypothetical protein
MSEQLRHQVFISSTFTDLRVERRKVAEALLQTDCIPAGMEMFPANDAQQMDFIKSVIDDCDYYVVIIGGRYGSISEQGLSYTELEYQYARDKGLPVLAFLHEDPGSISVDRSEIDPDLRVRLDAFKAELQRRRVSKGWANADDLVAKVVMAVMHARKTHPRPGWVRGGNAAASEVLNDLVRSQRRIEELSAMVERSFDEEDLTFPDMQLGYSSAGFNGRDRATMRLDDIFLLLAGSLAVGAYPFQIKQILEDAIMKETVGKSKVDLLTTDQERIQSYLFARGLVDVEIDQGDRVFRITAKGKKVLLELMVRPGAGVRTIPMMGKISS